MLNIERELLDHLRRDTNILSTIAETQKFDDDTASALAAEIDKVKESFRAEESKPAGDDAEHAKALDDEHMDNEQITVQRGN